MRFHFANSAIVPARGNLVCAGAGRSRISLNVRYGIIEHPGLGPILVDAGYAPRVLSGPGRSLPLRAYGAALGAKIIPEGHPEGVLERLGYSLGDVRHIFLTHLHADHLGYLDLFPEAALHTGRTSADLLESRPGLSGLGKGIFRELLPDPKKHDLHVFDEEAPVQLPQGLEGGYDIFADQSCIAVPLPGHAAGHYGLFFPHLEDPLLYAVDAAWSRTALLQNRAPGWPASLVAADQRAEQESAARLRHFCARGGTVALCHEAGRTPYDIPFTFEPSS